MQSLADPTRPPSVFMLAWRQTLRDFRAGELRLLAVAVLLAVAALTAVGFFADRLSNGLTRDARQLLGGDAVVASDRPTPPELVERARVLGLQTATTTGFPSMARAPDVRGGATRLVAAKAVSDSYPLRGSLTLKDGPAAPEQPLAAAPPRGEAWVDPALLEALQLQPGDPLLLGDATLTITRLIVVEPDRGAGFMSFAPRVMFNAADLDATGLIQPASRVTYRLAVAGTGSRGDAAVREFVRQAEERILPAAQDKGIAVLINMPFEKARLFKLVEGRSVPEFAREAGMTTWAQFFLKWVISHPAVTAAIPATANPEHQSQNMAALRGPLPDTAMRARMLKHMETIPGFDKVASTPPYPGKSYPGLIRRAMAARAAAAK